MLINMKTSFATHCLPDSCKNFKSSTMKRQNKSCRRMFSPFVLFLTYLSAFLVVSAEARISTSGGRHDIFHIISRDIGMMETDLPTSATSSAGSHESRLRRGRRSARERDFVEFRKFLHQLRNARRGGGLNAPGHVRRDYPTLSERSSPANKMAKNFKCGECQLRKQWIPVSKPGCRTNYVLTPTCMGMCETWQIPDVNPPYVTTHHRVCRPTQLEFRRIRLQRCLPGVNAYYVVPIAKNCACMKCKSINTACRPL